MSEAGGYAGTLVAQMRVVVILAGVVLGLAGFWLVVIYGYIIGLGCEGTDAGEPPAPGSAGAALCDSPALPVALVALLLVALVAPIVGGVIAARRRGWASFWGAAAIAAAAVSAQGLLLHVVEGGTESVELFVGAPLVACLGLTVLALRRRRAERRQ